MGSTKVRKTLWGEINDDRRQSMATQNSINSTRAAQKLTSIPSCNKLLPLKKPLDDNREFAWRSAMDYNVVESVDLMSNYLNTCDLHESQAEPAFIIADFTEDICLGSSSKASKEWLDDSKISLSPLVNQKDARELLQKSVSTLLIHKGYSVSRKSALVAIVELVEKFFHRLGSEFTLTVKGDSNPSTLVVASETALQNAGMQSGIEGILKYYQQDVLHHKVFLKAYIGRANQMRDAQNLAATSNLE